jgi:hypothetical protein
MKASSKLAAIAYSCVLITLMTMTSCQKHIPFEKAKWSEQTDPAFPSPYRQQMLSDLMTSYDLVGMKYGNVTALLGKPDGADSNYFAYRIVEEYGSGIDPVYIKNLVFNFSKDSVVTAVNTDEWKAK